jgi:hypothetical protein
MGQALNRISMSGSVKNAERLRGPSTDDFGDGLVLMIP